MLLSVDFWRVRYISFNLYLLFFAHEKNVHWQVETVANASYAHQVKWRNKVTHFTEIFDVCIVYRLPEFLQTGYKMKENKKKEILAIYYLHNIRMSAVSVDSYQLELSLV